MPAYKLSGVKDEWLSSKSRRGPDITTFQVRDVNK